MRPCRTFCIRGFASHRYQRSTLRLLPAGATVAGWAIFLPLDQRALFTAHEIFWLKEGQHLQVNGSHQIFDQDLEGYACIVAAIQLGLSTLRLKPTK